MDKSILDLTKGNVRKQLIIYSVPLITTSILQSVYSIVDILIAGRVIGSIGISAINNSGQIMDMITKIAIGLSIGGNILISQYFGGKDDKSRKESVGTLFTITMIIGVTSAFLLGIFSKRLCGLLGAPALNESASYLKICSVGLIFVFGYNGLSAVLRAVGDSKTPLDIMVVSTLTNIFLDVLLMVIIPLGVKGAAIATTISQGISFALGLYKVIKNPQLFGLELSNIKVHKDKLIKILKLGIPCALQMTIAAISWLVVTYYINSYGVEVSAGNGISINIKNICQLVITAMTNGAATMIAQNLGAHMYDRGKEVMYETMKITSFISIVLIIFVEIMGPNLARIFTNDINVINAAVLNLRIEIIGQLFYAIFLTYHALATGAGDTLFVMGSSFFNCIIVRVVLSAIFNHYFGIKGLYFACMIAPFSSVPLGMIYTRSNIWRKNILNNN